MYAKIIDRLLTSENPFIRYKVRVNVMDDDPSGRAIGALRREMKNAPVAQTLLAEQDKNGRIAHHPYKKWIGSHWVLAQLADLDYPPGDKRLLPLRDQVLGVWLSRYHVDRVPVIDGRARRCGSQEGNALYSIIKLGLDDGRSGQLVDNLLKWQWPDGGWNCDKNPQAVNSSFMETLIPLRGLSLYGKTTGASDAAKAARKAADIFLKRKIFKIKPRKRWKREDFVKIHYPPYWHYDILFGLKVLAEAGFIRHPACTEALDLLESKRLPDGGFAAAAKYYRVTDKAAGSNISRVDWGGTSPGRMNEYVTADSLTVLKAAGRL